MRTVAVIGAGVVGSSVAFRLARGGAKVWLVDRGQPGSGTTGASFAWANANRKRPRDYFELNYAGMREHARLADELGSAPWFHGGGNLIWDATPEAREEQEREVELLRAWGYAAEWRDVAEVRAALEPNIALPPGDLRLAYFPKEGWVDAPLLAGTMTELARQHGAEPRLDTAVEAIERDGGRVAAIRLASGERVPVDAVVNAAGPGADRVAALAGLPLPLAPTRGLVVRVATGHDLIGRVVHAPGINLRPDGPGHLVLHHAEIDERIGERDEIATDDPLCEELLRRARQVLPAIEDATIARARIGIRPIPADERSCVGSVPALPGYYEAVTHSGVTLGPLLGRLLAAEILSGTVDPLAAPFRPDRFPRA